MSPLTFKVVALRKRADWLRAEAQFHAANGDALSAEFYRGMASDMDAEADVVEQEAKEAA